MRTLHIGLQVSDLERSIAFYTAVGYEVLGEVPATEFGSLTMLKLPDDDFVSIELVHDPAKGRVEPGGLHHLVINVDAIHDRVARSPVRASRRSHRARPTAPTVSGRPGSPTRTATASSWSSGRRGTRTE